jgi:hypothetical protein
MLNVVGNMSKESPARFQFIDVLKRLFNPKVRRMFPEAQAVKHKHVEVAQRVECLTRNLAEIRKIRKIVKAISHYRQATMNNFERRYLQFVPDAEACPGNDSIWNHIRQAATKMRWLEDVFEDAFNINPGALIGADVKRAKAKVQRPDVIKTKDVVGVAMSDQNSVEMFQSETQRLLPEIGRSVNEDCPTAMFDDD